MATLHKWADGTWCYDEDLDDMTHMSDDYETFEGEVCRWCGEPVPEEDARIGDGGECRGCVEGEQDRAEKRSDYRHSAL